MPKSPIDYRRKAQRDSLREEKYFVSNAELYEALHQLFRIIVDGKAQGFESDLILAGLKYHIRETLLCNDALWHLYSAEEKALVNKQNRERRRERKTS